MTLITWCSTNHLTSLSARLFPEGDPRRAPLHQLLDNCISTSPQLPLHQAWRDLLTCGVGKPLAGMGGDESSDSSQEASQAPVLLHSQVRKHIWPVHTLPHSSCYRHSSLVAPISFPYKSLGKLFLLCNGSVFVGSPSLRLYSFTSTTPYPCIHLAPTRESREVSRSQAACSATTMLDTSSI